MQLVGINITLFVEVENLEVWQLQELLDIFENLFISAYQNADIILGQLSNKSFLFAWIVRLQSYPLIQISLSMYVFYQMLFLLVHQNVDKFSIEHFVHVSVKNCSAGSVGNPIDGGSRLKFVILTILSLNAP